MKTTRLVIPALQLMLVGCGIFSLGLAQVNISDTTTKPPDTTTVQLPDTVTVTLPDTSAWRIRIEQIFNENGEPANPFVADLLQRLAAETGPGKPVSREEFVQLLQRIDDDTVYTSQIIKYATPISKKIQDGAHASYASKVMKPAKYQAGIDFYRQHQGIFESAAKNFGVLPKDILGILMWESALGKYTGKYRIFNVFLGQILFLEQAEQVALHRLKIAGDSVALAPPDQTARFNRLRSGAVKNAAVLVRVTKETGANPFSQLGSWGGAIGYVQFMPASLRFAVDADSNGVINLTDWPDAIHSVANYLQQSGYAKTPSRRKRAILAYNRLDSYANGVMNYADSTWYHYEKKVPKTDSTATDSTTTRP